MNLKDLTRPDKLILEGVKAINDLGQSLYSNQKTEAKAKAQLTFIGKKKVDEIHTQLYEFNEETWNCRTDEIDYQLLANPQHGKTYWLNFHGLHDAAVIEQAGIECQLDRLTVRQVLDTTLRPKVEDFENYVFFSVKSIIKSKDEELNVEQLSFVLGRNHVISFQEEVGDHFDGPRDKIEEGVGFIRKKTADYLLVQLLDAIIDNYFETIDQINAEIQLIEKTVFDNPSKATLIVLEAQKRSAQVIKKSLGPFKEALQNIMNGRTEFIRKDNVKFFKDLENSTSAAIDEIEATLRTLESLTNIYFASLSQKMNETMKVLTTVATIFIPLTFIAGIYGMNFENMPELKYKNGYYITWGVMGVLTIGMLIYFKRKKWI